jgi:hypothetical protein
MVDLGRLVDGIDEIRSGRALTVVEPAILAPEEQ